MDVLLAVLRDVVSAGGSPLRCAVIPSARRSKPTVYAADGQEVPYSLEFVCRVASAPAVGTAVTAGDVTGAVSAVVQQDQRGPWMRHARVYVTTRTDITGPLPTEVTIYPSTVTTDVYGTGRRAPGAAGATLPARLDQPNATEDTRDGQRRTQTWTLTVDGDLAAAGMDAWSKAVDADGTEWALVGDPVVRVDPTGGTWSQATVRRHGDGSAS